MTRTSRWAAAAVLAAVAVAQPLSCLAGDPARELAAARRLACAYVQGVTAGFTPQGRVAIKPPLDPNTPGLTISLTDPEKKRAVLEEDAQETPGVYLVTDSGLTVFARYPGGGVAVVTVYPLYSGASDSFLMVASHHGATTTPAMSQRYGLCRLASETPAAPPPPVAPGQGHP